MCMTRSWVSPNSQGTHYAFIDPPEEPSTRETDVETTDRTEGAEATVRIKGTGGAIDRPDSEPIYEDEYGMSSHLDPLPQEVPPTLLCQRGKRLSI